MRKALVLFILLLSLLPLSACVGATRPPAGQVPEEDPPSTVFPRPGEEETTFPAPEHVTAADWEKVTDPAIYDDFSLSIHVGAIAESDFAWNGNCIARCVFRDGVAHCTIISQSEEEPDQVLDPAIEENQLSVKGLFRASFLNIFRNFSDFTYDADGHVFRSTGQIVYTVEDPFQRGRNVASDVRLSLSEDGRVNELICHMQQYKIEDDGTERFLFDITDLRFVCEYTT